MIGREEMRDLHPGFFMDRYSGTQRQNPPTEAGHFGKKPSIRPAAAPFFLRLSGKKRKTLELFAALWYTEQDLNDRDLIPNMASLDSPSRRHQEVWLSANR
ncbi:MAG: hypothetical protein PUH70_04710 [Clostridiales bacterium]|nr:hypothetical protein [Clostridiales bacterium]MDY5514051.1 hypothetical protein [Candidatus Ventricola sp.]